MATEQDLGAVLGRYETVRQGALQGIRPTQDPA